MVTMKLHFLLFINLFFVPDGNTQRRISSGTEVPDRVNRSYVVYLLKAPQSKTTYDEWLCGGALVSPTFILTSAACVEDVVHMYAIAGYKKYVRNEYLETDECTKAYKKKVVKTYSPVKYEFSFRNLSKWSYVDIALAEVENPYSLEDEEFIRLCSYIPTVIPISYEARFSEPGVDALIFGWGHASVWRSKFDTRNYNIQNLMYASVAIIDKETCKKLYDGNKMNTVIDRYMICSYDRGILDADGNVTYGSHYQPPVKVSSCSNAVSQKMSDILGEKENPLVIDLTRRKDCGLRSDPALELNITYGFCQNDHGGPLVTWVGTHEAVIGVASVFKVTTDRECIGPYLYTSTYCAGSFIDCVLTGNSTSRRGICDKSPIQRGYDIVERFISWKSHHDGSSENSDEESKHKTKGNVKYYEQFGTPEKFWEHLQISE